MAEIKLTPSQQAVIEDRSGVLLVSAAAGSGKTKVLVDRLLGRVCDPENACNIDDFLVITYTNAAAAELRSKIAKELNARLSEEPENHHLQKQMRRLYLAQISTVHSFCADLLRSYGHLLNMPADFRLMEEMESGVLCERVLEDFLEQCYEEADGAFTEMVDTFGYGRDDKLLKEAVMAAYRAMRCRADMEGWLQKMLAVLDMSRYADMTQTPWGGYIITEYREFLCRQIENLRKAVEEMQAYPNIQAKYRPVFLENIGQMEEVLQKKTWDELYENRITGFGRVSAIKEPEDPAVKERLADLRTKCWADLKKWQTLIFAPSAELLEDLRQVTPAAAALLRFTAEFDKRYGEEKRRRKLLDFSDLEHLAIRLLTDRYTGEPTAAAREIAQRYVEIMVDEYQDSNQVQEVIFEAVSKNGSNRFMVGDVKQSIYRFRLADPTLFLQKYEQYPIRSESRQGEPRKILLSENFRSRPEILSACNDVFRLIMRKSVGELDYGEQEALRPGRQSYPPLPQTAVELHCLTDSSAEETQDKRELEAEFVARRIRRMLDEKTPVTDGETTRPVRPGDIVILMRAMSGNAQPYLRALREQGIPAVCSQGGDLLDTTEVQCLIAMLQVVDDPYQDIPLLTVLAGPVYGCTPDELAQVRAAQRKGTFYEAICAVGGSFVPFTQAVEQLREQAAWISLHELAEEVLQKTNLQAVFASMPDGAQRQRNLQSFMNDISAFERQGNRTLSQLLQYLEDCRSHNGVLPVPQAASGDAVTLMTVHKSKGLEFPVVFLSDLSHQFNRSDTKEAVLTDEELAVGCNRTDPKRFIRYPTLAKLSIERKKRKESLSEELRVLYVAMTRAKDMLVMTYYSKRLDAELKNLASCLTVPISDDLCAGVNSPGKWILLAALCRTEAGELFAHGGENAVSRVSETPWHIAYHDLSAQQKQVRAEAAQEAGKVYITQEQLDLLTSEYPYSDICSIPAKLTATQLKGRMQDKEVAEGAAEPHYKAAPRFRTGSFFKKEMTAAEKGTATHLFMQFAAYEACTTKDGIEAERSRLLREEFLTEEQADAVDTAKILRFFTSELGQWLLKQKTVRREFKFSVLEDAGDYWTQGAGEQVMLQGVVDCFVIGQDGITILDFKTDIIRDDLQKKADYYRPQLEAYAGALSKIYSLPVKEKILYFFSGGETVKF